jgi:hypothetical protein
MALFPTLVSDWLHLRFQYALNLLDHLQRNMHDPAAAVPGCAAPACLHNQEGSRRDHHPQSVNLQVAS